MASNTTACDTQVGCCACRCAAPPLIPDDACPQGCKDYDVLNTAHPKPSKAAQAKVPGAHKLPYSDIYAKSEQRPLLNLETKEIPTQVRTPAPYKLSTYNSNSSNHSSRYTLGRSSLICRGLIMWTLCPPCSYTVVMLASPCFCNFSDI